LALALLLPICLRLAQRKFNLCIIIIGIIITTTTIITI
jgi:hypothetical protein